VGEENREPEVREAMPTTKVRKGKEKASSARAAKNGQKSSRAKATKSDKKATRPAKAAPRAKDTRQLVQERKLLRSQSRWLQKALFALDKAEDDHDKLAEVRGERHVPMAVTIDGTKHHVGAVTDSLRDSVMDRLERLRATLRNEHALLG
jgi:hypothetical protein